MDSNNYCVTQNSVYTSEIYFIFRERDKASAEEERIWKAESDAELEYQRKLEDALAEDEVYRMHPFRRAVSGRRSASNVNSRHGHHSAPIFS